MNYATRIAPALPLNAAEIEACERFAAEQAFAATGYPEWARDRWITAYRATHRGLKAAAGGSQALKAENRRRDAEQDAIYRETYGLPNMNRFEAAKHVSLARSKA